jgi:hypothetical protein
MRRKFFQTNASQHWYKYTLLRMITDYVLIQNLPGSIGLSRYPSQIEKENALKLLKKGTTLDVDKIKKTALSRHKETYCRRRDHRDTSF